MLSFLLVNAIKVTIFNLQLCKWAMGCTILPSRTYQLLAAIGYIMHPQWAFLWKATVTMYYIAYCSPHTMQHCSHTWLLAWWFISAFHTCGESPARRLLEINHSALIQSLSVRAFHIQLASWPVLSIDCNCSTQNSFNLINSILLFVSAYCIPIPIHYCD